MKGIIKLIIIYILRFVMRILYIFPIKKNRIVFSSYRGQQYSCNPKYICEKLLQLYPDDFEIIWVFNDPEKFSFLKDKGIKLVKFKSLKRFYYEATAKVSINNIGSFSWLPIRKGQEHVNTWHSGLDLENCGMNETENDKITQYTIGLSGKETTLFISANKVFTDYSVKVQFDYHGMMLNCGLPRGDNLINNNAQQIRNNVRKSFNVDKDTIIIMYAPTWRYGGLEAMPEMDYLKISKAMKERFGDNFIIWNRSHHIIGVTNSVGDEHYIDVTNYPDIQELVVACDILISDYSSVIWDGAMCNKYIIQYAPDAEEFEKERGLYTPVGKWCVPATLTMNGLCEYIKNIDFSKGQQYSKNLLEMMGSYETGYASEIVCNWIVDKCNGDSKLSNKYQQYLFNNNSDTDKTLIEKFNAQESLIN